MITKRFKKQKKKGKQTVAVTSRFSFTCQSRCSWVFRKGSWLCFKMPSWDIHLFCPGAPSSPGVVTVGVPLLPLAKGKWKEGSLLFVRCGCLWPSPRVRMYGHPQLQGGRWRSFWLGGVRDLLLREQGGAGQSSLPSGDKENGNKNHEGP